MKRSGTAFFVQNKENTTHFVNDRTIQTTNSAFNNFFSQVEKPVTHGGLSLQQPSFNTPKRIQEGSLLEKRSYRS